ncbi:NECAP-like protein [Chionoecetes opilio]|uniref:NECAP-like protein n=1 Tax=Chionoecetes opilio TaxID=41210 RepID=A0A8J4XPP2_CHIOP|nr:NECAP-like protein [Chionoecetes opilio]
MLRGCIVYIWAHDTRLHRLRQSPDSHWCRNISETIEHFLLPPARWQHARRSYCLHLDTRHSWFTCTASVSPLTPTAPGAGTSLETIEHFLLPPARWQHAQRLYCLHLGTRHSRFTCTASVSPLTPTGPGVGTSLETIEHFLLPPARAADWNLGTPDWTGRMRLVNKKEECIIKLEDKMSGELFAKCLIDKYPGVAIEAVTDSSRYFVLRIQDEGGRSAFIGVGFGDRSDSFDLNVALQDHFKWMKKEEEAEKEAEKEKEEGKPNLDLGFKDGQTIKINMKITGACVLLHLLLVRHEQPTSTRHWGVAKGISSKLQPSVVEVTPVDERIMRVRMKYTLGFMSFVAVYAPTEVFETEEKEMFYANLGSVLDQCPPLIVLGDFNATTDTVRDGYELFT